MRKRCAFRVRYVLFSLKCYSEDIDEEALLFGTPMKKYPSGARVNIEILLADVTKPEKSKVMTLT